MLKLLERSVRTVERRLLLLAPPDAEIPATFHNVAVDPARHARLVSQMQRLRGAVYLEDGAVRPDHLSSEGLHRTPEDERSWHLLVRNSDRQITSCVWYLEHDEAIDFEQLRVRTCPLNHQGPWRAKLHAALDSELARARGAGLKYAEVGGWTVARENRCTSEGLLLALAAYSLGRKLGGALGITTATVRHSSSTILRRLGGSHLQADGDAIPPYFDPKYQCVMELLRFDSRSPNQRYSPLIELLRDKLAHVSVVATDTPAGREFRHVPLLPALVPVAAAV